MEENQSVFDLQVDQAGARNLSGASAWAKFLAVVVFIILGLTILALVLAKQQIADSLAQIIPGMGASQSYTALVAAIAITAIICIVLMVLLFSSAVRIRRGIQTRNQLTFNSGLSSLKSYFAMYGVLSILFVVLKIISLLTK